MNSHIKTLFFLPTLIAGFGLAPVGLVVAQPYTFGSEVKTTSTGSLTYNPGTGAFQFTNGVGSAGYAYLPLTGSAASLIAASNGWTASLAVNITATTMTNLGGGGTPINGLALGVFSGSFTQDRIFFILSQVNNTAGTDLSDYVNGFYGTAAKFSVISNGNEQITTLLDGSQSGSEGDSYLALPGSGTNASTTTEPVGSAAGVLTLAYNASAKTVTGFFNKTPVGSYSIASWGSNPPLTLAVAGSSSGANVGVPVGADTASNFFAGTLAANAAEFTLQSATNLSTAVWSTNLNVPVVVNGQYTVTNPISGTQKFYELSQ
jgi:hypothetical protein